MSAPRVIVESPYAGNVERNIRYARAACRWLLQLGKAPFAAHLIYGQCIDGSEGEREFAMQAGMSWRSACAKTTTLAFIDFGISAGMRAGMTHARSLGQEVEEISLCDVLGDETFAKAMREPALELVADAIEIEAIDIEDHEPQIGGA